MNYVVAALYVLGFALTATGALLAARAAKRAYAGEDIVSYNNLPLIVDAVGRNGGKYLLLLLGGGALSTLASVLSVFV